MNYIKTPELTFSEFNGKWEVRKLGELIKVNMCKRIFSNQTTPIGEIPFYKIGTLGNKPDSYISRELFEEYKNKYNFPRKGEILITCSGTVGKTIVYDGRDSYYQDSNIVWLENNNKIIYNNILRILLSKIDWSKRLNSTTIIRLYNDDIRNLKIEFPVEKEEQQKIGDFFILLDKRIEQQEQKIALLKDYKKAMMQKIFSQKIRFKDENGNDYPDWEEKKLGEIVYRNSKKNKDQKYTLIQSISNKYGFVNQEDYFEDRRVGSLDVSNYYVINNGCFAYNPSRIDVGSLAYKNDNDISIISPLYVSFKGNAKHINDKFLLGWLFSHKFVGKLGRLFEGSVRNTLSYENLSTIDIETPCIAEQEKIALFLEVINDSIENQKELLDEIIKEKTALLNKMFI